MQKTILAATLFSVLMASSAMAAADKVLVYVNDTPIHESDVEKQMDDMPQMLTMGREGEIREALLDRLVQQQLILQQADQLKIDKDPEFKAELEQLRDNLVFNYVISHKLKELVTPEAIQSYYDAHKNEFAYPAVEAAHILVKDEASAEAIIKQLEDGADFAKLAKEQSTGPAASNGGDLGWFGKGLMVQPFEDAAFSLKKGEFTKKPVKTQFGWHVILVKDKNMKYVPPLSEVEDKIRETMGHTVLADYLNDLKSKAKIRYVGDKDKK